MSFFGDREVLKRKGYRLQTTGHSVLRENLCLRRGDALRSHRLKGEMDTYIGDVPKTCASLEAGKSRLALQTWNRVH